MLKAYSAFDMGLANKFHTAIDWHAPYGTPVYAIADGNISYSQYEADYAGLIIIDHPVDNLYSLYGHLSYKMWSKEVGPVKKGELIGYIANTNEGYHIGIYPHLHFSIRLGQKSDYPESGEARRHLLASY